MKRNKGITMISLVVTIIVLIILAGVSINMVIGDNGIITIAQKAKENTELARIEEEEQLNNLYEEFQNSGGIIDDGSDTEAIEKLENFKKIIATAITNEGVLTAETDTAETMAENIGKIMKEQTKNATATADNITEGKTAYVNGELIIGSGADNEENYNNGYVDGNTSSYYFTTKSYYSSSSSYSCSFNLASECPNYANAKYCVVQRTGGNIFVRDDTNSATGSCGIIASYNKSTGTVTISCEATVMFWRGQTYNFNIVLLF